LAVAVSLGVLPLSGCTLFVGAAAGGAAGYIVAEEQNKQDDWDPEPAKTQPQDSERDDPVSDDDADDAGE
jgi:hypothetical protein